MTAQLEEAAIRIAKAIERQIDVLHEIAGTLSEIRDRMPGEPDLSSVVAALENLNNDYAVNELREISRAVADLGRKLA